MSIGVIFAFTTALLFSGNVSCFQSSPSFAISMQRVPKRMHDKLSSPIIRQKATRLASTSSVVDASHTSSTDDDETTTSPSSSVLTTSTTPLGKILDPSTTRQKYGVPIGVVRLPSTFIQPFRQVIQKALPELKHVHYRGVDNRRCSAANKTNPEGGVVFKDLHVQTDVAAAIMGGNTQIIQYIHECGGTFLSGARRKRSRRRMSGSGKFCDLYSDNSEDDEDNNDSDKQNGIQNNKPKFTFVELFAGVGGFRFGLQPLGGHCVLASERDEVACAIYRRQFGPAHLIEGDMLDVSSKDYPPNGFDLLTAGFPCQPFSARGEQKGLDDDGHRGQMYQELVRTLMEERPKFFLFENVVGLLKMDGGIASHRMGQDGDREHIFKPGKVMNVIIDAFRSCGYKVQWHVVNSKHFVPQHRERVYFFGSQLELDCPDMEWDKIYPADNKDDALVSTKKRLRDYLEKDYATNAQVAECELTQQQWETVQQKCNGDATHILRLKVEDACAPTLISSYRTPASASTRFVMEEADGTLRHGDPLLPRFLTPTEFRRMMGFPAEFDVSPITRDNGAGHIYQVMGNAVVPPVIEAVGREIVCLMEHVEKANKKYQC